MLVNPCRQMLLSLMLDFEDPRKSKSERLGFSSVEERLGYALQLEGLISRRVAVMMSRVNATEDEVTMSELITLIDDVLSWTPIVTHDLPNELDNMGILTTSNSFEDAILQLVAQPLALSNFLRQVFLQVSLETISILLTAYPEVES